MERVLVRACVRHLDGQEDVERVGLRVVRLDDPVAVVVEDPRVHQLELRVELRPARVLLHEPRVGELRLRVVVAPPVPRVTRRRVEVPPVLLGVLSVVPLVAGEAEDPLLQDRVAAVPEREPETEALLDVAEAGEPVLAPPVRPRAGMVVREVLPRGAVGAVVLAHRPPLALADVGAPQIPVARLPQTVLEPAEALDPPALRALLHPEPPSRPAPTSRAAKATTLAAALVRRGARTAARARSRPASRHTPRPERRSPSRPTRRAWPQPRSPGSAASRPRAALRA